MFQILTCQFKAPAAISHTPLLFSVHFYVMSFFAQRKRKGSLGASLSLKPLLTTLVQVVDGCVSLSSFLFKASQSCLFLCASVEKL